MSFDKPSPELIPDEQEIKSATKKNLTWLYLLILVVVVMCLGGIAISLGYTVFQRFNGQKNTEATQTAAVANTQAAQQAAILREAESWELVIDETFDENTLDWYEGDVDDEYVSMTLSIDNGNYLWDGVAKQGFVWRVWPESDDYTDFYLSVDAQNLGENSDAQVGLIFSQTEDQYYLFDARDDGSFEVYKSENGEWTDLISLTTSAAIRPDTANKLSVISQDGWFTFFINDQWVGEEINENPLGGQVGVAIGVSNEGETATIAFDNFVLRVP
ncbi:MAG: hypothetical protein J7L73_07700 [Anaerolineales bacterium]|nr:hypothetical protein [Anaerolineales bacterium]